MENDAKRSEPAQEGRDLIRRLDGMKRIILHSDMNACYASIELLYHPELRGRPLAVGGDPELRHGIVLAKSQEAKKAGVKTGMALWQARECCPDIIFIPPHYDRYMRFSRLAHEIYADYTDLQEPFGLDECWLDTTASCTLKGDGMRIAGEISRRVKKELGVTVSVGVSWNKIYAKFGSDYRKPDAITEITEENYREIVWPQPVEDLLYVGHATSRKLRNVGICTVGSLAGTDPEYLHHLLGKAGLILWVFANGRDRTPVSREGTRAPIKSIGNGITAPRDLENDEDIRIVIYMLSESVGARLRENRFKGYVVGIAVRNTDLEGFTRQRKISVPTNITEEIAETAIDIFRRNYVWRKPVRSVNVRVSSIVPDTVPYQTDMFISEERREKQHRADVAVDDIRRRFGNHAIRRGIMLRDSRLAEPDIRNDNTIHPMSYMGRGNRTGVSEIFRDGGDRT